MPATPPAAVAPGAVPWLPPSGTTEPAAAAPDAVAATAPPLATTPETTDRERIGLDATVYWQHFAYAPPFAPVRVTGTSDYLRGVLDFRHAWRLFDGAQFTVSDRLDYLLPLHRFDPAERRGAINALREAYVSLRLDKQATTTIEIGRVNIRNGVGAGYNPTDFLKEAAVVTSTSRDPGALRYNRLGTVLVSVNRVADWGSASVALIPGLQRRDDGLSGLATDRPSFYLGLDRTNSSDAALAKVSPRINDRVSLDLLAYWRARRDPSFGANVSALLSSSLVGNLEVAAVRRAGLPALDGDRGASRQWFARLAANVTWTTPLGLEITAELIHAGDALGKRRWDALRRSSLPADIGLLQTLATERGLQQEPLTKTGYFVYLNWRDAFSRRGLALSAFVTGNVFDGSSLWQASAGQAFGAWTVGALASGVAGSGVTEYGASSLRTYVALSVSRRF